MAEESGALVCQSCGLEIAKYGGPGTNADGTPNPNFCDECYHEGKFRSPRISMRKMAELSAESKVKEDPEVNYDHAYHEMMQVLPSLDRWRTAGR